MTRLALRSPALLLLNLLCACATKGDDTGADGDGGATEDGGSSDGGAAEDGGSSDGGATEDGGASDGGAAADDIAIAGAWVDNWGSGHEVDNNLWLSGSSSFAITTYDNDQGMAVAQNGAENPWGAKLWSRFDWGWSDGELLYCQTAYAAASEADALATPAADLGATTTGCGGFSWSVLRAPFSLTDTWDDAWGGQHQVDAFEWQSGGSTFEIAAVDEDEQWLVAQNGAANTYSAGLWSRFDWTWDSEDGLYYCQTAYAAESEEEATATTPADGADLAAGCGGFSWSELRPALAINGDWADAWGGVHSIDAFAWESGSARFDITQADDDAGWLVAQNADSNTYSPGLWSRFDWTWDGDGMLWYCQTAYDAKTEADAAATAAANPSDPANSGCGSFSWTSMVAE